jgi:MFS family permease
VSILSHRHFIRATVVNFFFFASLNGFVLLPLHIQHLGGTAVEVGVVMGIYSAVGIVVQPLLGPWIDALGRRPFMLFGVLAVLASALLAIVTNAIGWLAVVRVLQGLGFSAFFVANFAYIIDLTPPEHRGWALGLYGVSGLVSAALAPLLGEWIVRRFGFRPLFMVCAVLAVAAGVLARALRERRREVGHPVRGAEWVRLSFEGLLRLHMMVTFFFGLGTGTIATFVPTFAESLGVTTLALFYTAYAVAAMAVRVVGGRLIDTLGRRAVIVPSMFAQAVAASLLAMLGLAAPGGGLPAPLILLMAAGLIGGAAHGFLYPGLAALVTDRAAPLHRGAVVAVFSAVFLFGHAAGSFFFGYVVHALDYGSMWSLLTALLLAGAGVSLRLTSDRPAPAPAA